MARCRKQKIKGYPAIGVKLNGKGYLAGVSFKASRNPPFWLLTVSTDRKWDQSIHKANGEYQVEYLYKLNMKWSVALKRIKLRNKLQ